MKMTYFLNDIQKVAQDIIYHNERHKIFCFEGTLGAGKTTLIEQICRNLGSTDTLSSPTFTIINEYNSNQGVIYHMDWYRLKNEEEAFQIGVEDYLFSENYCFIEWYQNAEKIIPRPYILVQISNLGENQRQVSTKVII